MGVDEFGLVIVECDVFGDIFLGGFVMLFELLVVIG